MKTQSHSMRVVNRNQQLDDGQLNTGPQRAGWLSIFSRLLYIPLSAEMGPQYCYDS